MNTHAFIMVESMEAIPINGFVGFKLSSLPKKDKRDALHGIRMKKVLEGQQRSRMQDSLLQDYILQETTRPPFSAKVGTGFISSVPTEHP